MNQIYFTGRVLSEPAIVGDFVVVKCKSYRSPGKTGKEVFNFFNVFTTKELSNYVKENVHEGDRVSVTGELRATFQESTVSHKMHWNLQIMCTTLENFGPSREPTF